MGRKRVWISLFGITMAYFEAAVVVYLRTIAYPEGFQFPLESVPIRVALTEIGREAASLAMIWAVAALAGRGRRERFAVFLVVFGIWDIGYYLWLKVLLGWPASLFTWDVLFLIPVVWSAPVLAPVMTAGVMILVGWVLLKPVQPSGTKPGDNQTIMPVMPVGDWARLTTGAAIVFAAFIRDYLRFVANQGGGKILTDAWALAGLYTPDSFPWLLFLIGWSLLIWTGIRIFRAR